MSIEPALAQILRDVGERIAAHDLRDDAREQLGAGGQAAAKQRQPGVFGIDREPELAHDGAGVDALLHPVHGYAEFALAVADRPLVGVQPGVFRQQAGMEIQAASFEPRQ